MKYQRAILNTWESFGEHYGYPPCCVAAFRLNWCEETKRAYPDGPFMGTGFIPCIACAAEAAKDFPAWVAKNITPNRKCPTKFGSHICNCKE